MIHITDHQGRAHHLALASIASVSEPSTNAQWHGIRAYIHQFDGKLIEARENVAQILAQIEREEASHA